MKNVKRFLLSLLFIVCIFSLTGCKNKTSLKSNEFKSRMEAKNFIVYDATNQMQSNNYIDKIYVAVQKDSNYQIEYYELKNEDNAISFYNNNKKLFQSSKGSKSEEKSKSVNNYSKYTLETNDSYKVISRIDNTAIYINADIKYKKDIESVLKGIGY